MEFKKINSREMNDLKGLFIFGASGHGKVVIDIIEKTGIDHIRFIFDDNLRLKNSLLCGYKVAGGRDELLLTQLLPQRAIVTIGDNKIREKIAKWLVAKNYTLATAVHPEACLARGVTIGAGSVVMAGGVINSDSTIENNVIVNTKATIDHDCCIKSGAHIGPGATLCGGIAVGECAFIGAGATVIPNVQIGANAMIGAGTVVYKNVPANMRISGARNEW